MNDIQPKAIPGHIINERIHIFYGKVVKGRMPATLYIDGVKETELDGTGSGVGFTDYKKQPLARAKEFHKQRKADWLSSIKKNNSRRAVNESGCAIAILGFVIAIGWTIMLLLH